MKVFWVWKLGFIPYSHPNFLGSFVDLGGHGRHGFFGGEGGACGRDSRLIGDRWWIGLLMSC